MVYCDHATARICINDATALLQDLQWHYGVCNDATALPREFAFYYRTTAGTRQAHTSSLPQQEGIKTQQLPPEKGSPQEPQKLTRRGEFTLVKNPIFSSNSDQQKRKHSEKQEPVTSKFMGVPEGLHKASVRQVVPRVLAGPARQVAVRRSGSAKQRERITISLAVGWMPSVHPMIERAKKFAVMQKSVCHLR